MEKKESFPQMVWNDYTHVQKNMKLDPYHTKKENFSMKPTKNC
jgi:hypothetical protein